MPEDRRLAAIMFTDIVGYTALMGKSLRYAQKEPPDLTAFEIHYSYK